MSLLEKSSSIELSRRTQPFYAKKQDYSLGQQVQIEIDLQREFIDFENSRLVFEVKYTDAATPDNYTVNPFGASGFIKNLRIKTLAGQMIGHEIREYRAWYRMMKELGNNTELNTSYDDVLEGALADVMTATTTRQYAHKFITHLFSIKEYYPAHFHQGIMIEFDLPAVASELVINATGNNLAFLPVITIESMKYVADLVQLKPEIENEMVKMMEEQRLFADYQEVLTQDNEIAISGQTNFDIVGIDGRVKSIFNYQVKKADRGTDATPDVQLEYWAKYARNGQDSYRFKLGANYLNYENIKLGDEKRAEQIYELLKALDLHDSKAYQTKAGDTALSYSALNTDRFVLGVKVDKAQKNSDQTISSMIDKDRNNIRVELGVSSAVATSYTHISLDKRIQILPGSIVRNVRS